MKLIVLFLGQLIGSFKKLLPKMQKLCDLELVDLLLERYEANSLMDQMSISLNHSLKVLSAVNLTINHCPLQQIAMMSNLEVSDQFSIDFNSFSFFLRNFIFVTLIFIKIL